MKRMKKLKVSILSLFIAVFFMLPALNVPIQNDSVSHPIYHAFESSHIASGQDDFVSDSLYEEILEQTDYPHPQWNHNVLNIGQAWSDGYTGAGIRIAILDTGFFQHPDINMAGGNSVFPDDPWSNDHSGHGTHIAGIIGATSGTTYQGIAPGADLFGIKIYHENDVDEDGYVSTDTQSVAQGIQLAAELDADIIVISSGLTFHDEELYQQIQSAYADGIMIIAASGNGNDSINYPANYEEVVAVTAVDERLFPAMDIIYGQANEFAAPGVNIGGLSIPDSTYSYPYIYMSGSSQAAPHIAGMAAILMEKYNVRGEEARAIMQEQALDIGDPNLYGHGLLRYLSDEELAAQTEEPEEEPEEEPVPTSDPTDTEAESEIDAENRAVRKPTSSRAADTEDEGSLAYYQTEAILGETESTINPETIPLVESGGTLEIWLNDSTSLTLTNEQVNEIRERNITLVLAQESTTWTIPPANFLPGPAVLRFYENTPVGIPVQPGQALPLYTLSIYQADARRNAYPSWMDIRFDLSQYDVEDPTALQAYYWNRDEEAWIESNSITEGQSIILQTRHATTVGFFDSNILANAEDEEEMTVDVEPEEEIPEETDSSDSTLLVASIVGGILLFAGIIIFWRRRR